MSNEVSKKVFIEENVDEKLMITEITCSMLESPFTFDYDEMNIWVSKSTHLEPKINS